MAHGGTNFGFYNGANTGSDESDYKPDLTSYDYVRKIFLLCCNLVLVHATTNYKHITDTPVFPGCTD